MLEPLENDFAPYGPGAPTVAVIHRIHEGKSGSPLTIQKLQALGVASGNAVRVQRSLYFLGFIDENGDLTETSKLLRKTTTDEYPATLAEIIKEKYAAVFEICDPATANAVEISNAFRPFEPSGQRDNMIRLFIALCQEAGLLPQSEKRGRPALAPRKAGSAQKNADREKKREPEQQQPPSPIIPPRTDGVLFHPAVDAFLKEARKLTQGEHWTKEARDNVVQGFTTQLDLFLPVKKAGTQ